MRNNNAQTINMKQEAQYASAYLIIGLMAMAIDLGLYFLLYIKFGVNPILATIVSVAVAILFGFVGNQKYNFKVKNNVIKRFISYASINSIGMVLSIIFIYIFNSILGFNAGIVKVLSLGVIVSMQYLFNRFISFNKKTFISKSK
jgi:putative flippase GtrA